MYQKKSHGWYKHKDFILLDLLCIFLAFIFAYYIRNHTYISITDNGVYRNAMIFVLFADLVVIILFEIYTGVLRRGYYREFIQVLEQVILIELAAGLYLFTVDDGRTFSRAVLYLTGVVYGVLSYIVRIFWKKHLIRMMAERGEHSLYIITSSDIAESVVESVRQHNYNRYDINGIIVTDCDMTDKEIAGVPVVAASSDAAAFICQHWVDEVLINVAEEHTYPQKLYEELLEMGIVVHVNLSRIQKTSGQKQFVEKIGNYTVITTSMNYATDRQALVKRLIDIAGGLVGCILTGIIFIFVGPAIYISSPGPIFFSQTRIGQNGKPFKMYKFRSMYMDAEARKAELMSQNKMSDGRMFKLDFDPRVIGNKIFPDGRKKTGIGEFIRKTSLDEFPQFWNVLNGSMSLVGTRPILPDELEQYELHHRARIAIKPGITGMWQVSGRSDITDFEEIVRLDVVNHKQDENVSFHLHLREENGESNNSAGVQMNAHWYLEVSFVHSKAVIGNNVVLSYIDIHDELIPDNVVLHGLKQKNGKFVCRIYGVLDNPKENKLFGIDLEEVLHKLEIRPEDVWNSSEHLLWFAKLYPECDSIKELERGNIDEFAALLDYHWELSRKVDAGSTNTLIDQIFLSIEDLIDARMVCGAGGGGFLQVILKKGITKEDVHKRLKDVFQDNPVDVRDCEII